MSVKPLAHGLIIDDDQNFHEIITEGIKKFTFSSAHTFNQAKEILSSKIFSFILLDYRLNNSITGLDLISDIKKSQPMALILMISAFGSKHILQEAIEYNIDSYVDKPVNFKKLETKLRSLLNKKGLINTITLSESITHIKEKINNNEHNITNFELKNFAETNNKNYKYLSQKFKKETGKTFQQLKKEEKYKKVKELLINTSLSIKEISKQCGFSNPTAIMRGFKLFTGQTMTEFRKNTKIHS